MKTYTIKLVDVDGLAEVVETVEATSYQVGSGWLRFYGEKDEHGYEVEVAAYCERWVQSVREAAA